MTEFDSKELAQRTQDHLNGYVKFADQKASILLTAQLAFIGLYANILRSAWSSAELNFKLFSVLTIAAGIAAVTSYGWTIYPRTPGTARGLILWKSIADMGVDDYKQQMESLSREEAFEELLDENHKLATVASEKYRYLRVSLLLTAVMVGLALVAIASIL